MSESLDKFVTLLLRSELISPSQLQALRQQLSAVSTDTVDADLVKLLADSGHLTEFQASEVQNGKIADLVVGDYLLLHPVGRGGMGQVFKARHSIMKRDVAVKFILTGSDGKTDQSSIERFQREVEAASKLSHPNIVSALDAGRRKGVCYLVMEYVRGKNLAAYVRENGPMTFRQALDCMLQAAQALEYAHGKGVVHRDIKPSNLLLTDDGQIKLLDMGLVRTAYDDQSQAELETTDSLTHSGQLLGTVDFMAPEQALDPRTCDRRADIYSLGCTLYYLLTGKLPYRRDGKSPMGRIIAHRESPVPSLCKARTDVPVSFERVFQKMMAKQVQHRYQSVTELIADLRKAQLESQAAITSLTETETVSGFGRQSTLKTAGAALLLIGAVLLIAFGAYWSNRPAGTQQPGKDESSALEPPTVPTGPANMLGRIDLSRDVQTGTGWSVAEGKLLVPPSVPSKLVVPAAFPPEFRLEVRLTRTSGIGPFVLGVVEKGRSFLLLVDAGRNGGQTRMTALGMRSGGKLVKIHNDVLQLNNQEPVDLRLLVGTDSLTLQAGSRTVLEWQGNFQELAIGAGWGVSSASGVLIGSNDRASFIVERLELIPAEASSLPKTGEDPD